MKKLYTVPTCEVIIFAAEDILTKSPGNEFIDNDD